MQLAIAICDFFKIKDYYAKPYNFSNDISWFTNSGKPIIHRAVLDSDCLPHTEFSFMRCIESGLPIEVDLLRTVDKQIIVGRNDFCLSDYGSEKQLIECTKFDIMKINEKAGVNKLLYLDEFLTLIGGKIPVMLEIKIPYNDDLSEEERKYVDDILQEIEKYLRLYNDVSEAYGSNSYSIAVHSSTPFVINYIKQVNCMIPCGVITTDFSKYENVSQRYINMHKDAAYFDMFTPDFISCSISELGSNLFDTIKCKYSGPVLAWTIRNEWEKKIALKYCDNVIQEEMG